MKRVRQNMVTYPFHFQHQSPENFFKPGKGAVYLHIPFCNQKCKFCNFKAYKLLDKDYIESYLEALKQHIILQKTNRHYPELDIDSVYFGGGNPGLLEPEQMVGLLNTVRENYNVLPTAEISMEFDPVNVTRDRLDALNENGFNRISMGVQSFDDEVLKRVGRIHSGQDAIDAHELMRKAGFKNVNLDLVYPFPDLTIENWSETIDTLVSLNPNAVSTYGFELWPGTPYYNDVKKGNFKLCSVEEEAAMYDLANKKIMESGYEQVTVYGYVKKEMAVEFHCKFMEGFYWNNLPMIGLGVGAMNYMFGDFFVNENSVPKYMDAVKNGKFPISFGRHLSIDEQMRRFMIRGLKKTKVSMSEFFNRYGHEMEKYFEQEIESCVKQGLMTVEGDFIKLTLLGCNYNTNVYREFFRDGDRNREVDPNSVHWGLSLDIEEAMAGRFKK